MSPVAPLVTLIVFVLGHLFITVWWASRVNTLIMVVQRDLQAIIGEMKSMRTNVMSRDEVRRELSIAEGERKTLFDKVDVLQQRGL